MRRNEELLHLSCILSKCNELDFPCEPAIRHYGECIDEMADDILKVVQRMIDKPYNRCSRMQLVIDFDKMTDADYWTGSRIFCLLPKEKSEALKSKLEALTDMLRVLYLKMKQIDLEYAEKLLKRMSARCHKRHRIFDYELWKMDHPDYTLDMLLDKEVELTSELLAKEVLAYDEMPKDEELETVRLDLVQRHRKCNAPLPEGFEAECAKLRRYSYWDGKYLFKIDYPRIYRYLFMNCFEKFSKKQRMALYEYDVQLQMIHEDMQKCTGDCIATPHSQRENATLSKREQSPCALSLLPPELSSRKAQRILARAVDARLLTTDYQRPTGAEWWKMACMADTIGEELSLPNKWVVFCTLWGNNNLRKYNTDKQGLTDYNNFRKILKSQIL